MYISRRKFLAGTAGAVAALHTSGQFFARSNITQTTISGGALSATVSSKGKFGWCGLNGLNHEDRPISWLLAPALTLEHYLGIPSESPEHIQYEPCESPKYLDDIIENGCTLHYSPLPCSEVTCSISYRMKPPHYIDVRVRVQTKRESWPLGYLALFFATIVDAPVYTGVTINGFDEQAELTRENPWVFFNGYGRDSGRTAHPADVNKPELERHESDRDGYYYDDSSIRFDRPLFFGTIDGMVFGLMFPSKNRENVRFTVNPLAAAFGGPAWDFFWVIPDPVPGQTWELPLRVIWKPFQSRDDMLREYQVYDSDRTQE